MSIHERGFYSMSQEKRKAIASLGGKAAQAKGVTYKWTSDTAREASRKGVLARQQKRQAQP